MARTKQTARNQEELANMPTLTTVPTTRTTRSQTLGQNNKTPDVPSVEKNTPDEPKDTSGQENPPDDHKKADTSGEKKRTEDSSGQKKRKILTTEEVSLKNLGEVLSKDKTPSGKVNIILRSVVLWSEEVDHNCHLHIEKIKDVLLGMHKFLFVLMKELTDMIEITSKAGFSNAITTPFTTNSMKM